MEAERGDLGYQKKESARAAARYKDFARSAHAPPPGFLDRLRKRFEDWRTLERRAVTRDASRPRGNLLRRDEWTAFSLRCGQNVEGSSPISKA